MDVPVIVIKDEIQYCGTYSYKYEFTKPFRIISLIDTIDKVLDN